MRPLERLLLVAILLAGSASVAHAEADHAAIAQASLTEVIRPFYAALAEQTGALKGKVENLLTSGEGWLATADADGAMSCQGSGFQWDNHAILVS